MVRGKSTPGETRGRKSILTPQLTKIIVQALSVGNAQQSTAQYVGINPATFHIWKQRAEVEQAKLTTRGENPEALIFDASINEEGEPKSIEEMFDSPPPEFDENEWKFVVFKFMVDRARASAEVKALATIHNAMTDNWQAAGWFLERAFPDRYARRDRVNVSGSEDGQPVRVEHNISTDDLEAKLAKLREVSTDNEG